MPNFLVVGATYVPESPNPPVIIVPPSPLTELSAITAVSFRLPPHPETLPRLSCGRMATLCDCVCCLCTCLLACGIATEDNALSRPWRRRWPRGFMFGRFLQRAARRQSCVCVSHSRTMLYGREERGKSNHALEEDCGSCVFSREPVEYVKGLSESLKRFSKSLKIPNLDIVILCAVEEHIRNTLSLPLSRSRPHILDTARRSQPPSHTDTAPTRIS